MAWNNSNVVKEKAYLRDPGYAGTSTGAAGVVPAEDTATAAFVNERTAGNLRVSKKVTGSEGDKNQAFAFTVELSDSGINGKYGDRNHPMLWLEMVLAGIAGLVFTRKYRRSAKH